MENLSRSQEQNLIVQTVYQYLFYQEEMKLDKDVKEIMEGVYDTSFDEIPLFSKEAVVKTLLNQEENSKIISDNLVKWRLERLNRVERAILLVAISEFKYLGVDKAVVINNAVKLAKEYLDDKDYKFVNGILDKIL